MAKRRFDNLDDNRQRQILDAAAGEFAAHGYAGASYNRIIEKAGTSKGSMYYYFEDKQDLYATVVMDCTTRFMAWCGDVKPVATPEAFWAQLREMYVRGLGFYDHDPNAMGIIRSIGRTVITGDLGAVPLAELRERTRAFLQLVIAAGQMVGAIRTDLPDDLILTVTITLSEGIDLWWAENLPDLSPEQRDTTLDQLIGIYQRLATPEEEP